jgi:hypothetical protein
MRMATSPDQRPGAGGAPIGRPAVTGGQLGIAALRGLISGDGESVTGGRPIGPTGGFGAAGAPVRPVGVPPAPTISGAAATFLPAGAPVGGLESTFNIGGAPIAILGGVFGDGLPLGGPVGQIFRGTAPLPNTLFLDTITPGGPIGLFFIGTSGAPIGVPTFGGGGLPIEPSPPFAREIAAIGPLTAGVVGPPAPTGGLPITGGVGI